MSELHHKKSVNRAILILGLLAMLLFSTDSGVTEAVARGKKSTHATQPAAATEWEGHESELVDPFVGVVTGEEEWNDLWKRAFGKKAPPVDFSEFGVACVFLGHYPGWYYSIHIEEPIKEENTIVIPFGIVDLIVELRMAPGLTPQGNRGQYSMKIVSKIPDHGFRMEMVGHPQVPLKNGFPNIIKPREGQR
jgi:hypothetical protein